MDPWIIAGIVLLGVSFFSGSSAEKHVTDSEVAQVTNYALAHESDLSVLADLGTKIFEAAKDPQLSPSTLAAWTSAVVALHNKSVQLQGHGDRWIVAPWGGIAPEKEY